MMKYISLKKGLNKAIVFTGLTILTCLAFELEAQDPSDGAMTFTVRTETAGGNFSPKHVLAIWVEDSEGFVKTRKVNADKRKQYLYTWNSRTSSSVVDATTGETLLSHQTHSISWDCRDVSGNLVPDGSYTVYVEFTDQHAQGPIQMVSFTKGADSISLSPADETNFKDMELSFVPVSSPVSNQAILFESPKIFPNPSQGMFTIQWEPMFKESTVEVFDMRGSILYTAQFKSSVPHFVDISSFPSGLYLLKIRSEHHFSEQIIVKE